LGHRADLARATDRLNRLLDVFIDGTITKEDFTSHKERLVQEKATLADSVGRLEVRGANRFKPLIDFITASRQAKYDAQTDDLEELRNWHKKIGSNLILAAGILSGGGSSVFAKASPDKSAAQSPSLTDAPSRNPIAGLRGGSAARSPISPDIGKRVESPRIEENKAISSPSADGVTVTASASGEWSEFIPILPADVASLSAGSSLFGHVTMRISRKFTQIGQKVCSQILCFERSFRGDFGRRLLGQFPPQRIQNPLLVRLGWGVAAEDPFSIIGGREMDIQHLDLRELVEDLGRGQSPGMGL